MYATNGLPVAVIGGGPVGLAAAAHLLSRGLPVKLYEAGETVASNVLKWPHVRFFSPWCFNIDEVARSILREQGWQEPPADDLPTGRELYDAYLAPLGVALMAKGIIETKARVRWVSRRGIDKVVSRDRANRHFALGVNAATTGERIDIALAVTDASGTWQNPNPLGASGTAAAGKADAAAFISYGIPDVLQAAWAQYAGKHTLVVGGGHSTATVTIDLALLAESNERTRFAWALRSQNLARVFGGAEVNGDDFPPRQRCSKPLLAVT